MKKIPQITLLLAVLFALAATGCVKKRAYKAREVDYDAIVIGAGMGGLSAATHLQLGGMNTLLVEQHYKVGGCTTSFERGEFNFDAALHEMSMGGGPNGGLVMGVLRKAGLLDRVELIRVPQLGRSIFPSFEFVAPEGEDEYFAALAEKWPEEKEKIAEFRQLMRDLAEEVTELRDLYMANPVKALLTKLTLPLRQRKLFKYHNKTIGEVLDSYFGDNEEIKAVVAQFWVYYGPPPSRQWSIIYLIAQYGYILNGGWQIKGSSQALADAYRERFEELGGTVMTDTMVTSIDVEDNRVLGIEIDSGKKFSSSYVVSNADPYQTFFKLVGKDRTPKQIVDKVKKLEPSNSFAGVYLGLDVTPEFWGVEEYEIFLNRSLDADALYEASMAGRWDEGFMSMTLYGNLGDPFYAPEGKSVVTLHAYSDIDYWPEPGEEYTRKKDEMMDALISMAEEILPGLRDHIEIQVGMTPRTIKNYTLNQAGTPYGLNFTVEQQNRIEIPTGIDGLYMAGSWTWPSHSVGLAQTSGYLASQMIIKESGRLED